MDIFAIAQEGMKIQEQEIKDQQALEAEEAKAKSFKLDIFETMKQAANKNYSWLNSLGENQKHFQPYMLNLWMGMVWYKGKGSEAKAFCNNDKFYASMVKNINYTLNRDVYNVPKEMFWLLACTIQEADAPFTADYKKAAKRELSEKIPPKVIQYMSQELYSSKDKIMDMIDNGLITSADIASIVADFETIEETKKKKK